METTDAALERVTLGKVTLRLIPLMFVIYVFNILDRVNVNAAILTMKKDLGFSDGIYGLGYGIFFVGYFFFEVPSNVMLQRLGARLWITRIMLTWGLIACCMIFVRTSFTFYLVRFSLGVAEAGFFPGMLLYLTYWFPNSERGRAASRFVLAGAFANIIGGPLGAQFLKLNGYFGLHGWQWLFLLEGLPTVLLGFVVLFYFTDSPEQAHWLKAEEREWLVRKLADEQAHRQKYHHMTLLEAFAYPRVLHLSLMFFLYILGGAGVGAFQTRMLQDQGWTNDQILWRLAIPSILGAVALVWSAAISDRRRERRLHIVWGNALGAVGILLCTRTTSPWLTLLALCVVAVGTSTANAPFWALTTGFLSGAAAAGGIAFINSIGNSGSFFAPTVMGYLKDYTHDYRSGLYLMALTLAVAALVAYLLPPDPATEALRSDRDPAEADLSTLPAEPS